MQSHGNVTLRYTLVAVLENDTDTSANTSCGLREALAHHSAVAGPPVNVSSSDGTIEAIEASLPALQERIGYNGFSANVLVEVFASNGSCVDAHAYTALIYDAASALKLMSPGLTSGSFGAFLLILGGVGGFLLAVNKTTSKDAEGYTTHLTELEEQYEFPPEPGASASSRRVGYVPPAV